MCGINGFVKWYEPKDEILLGNMNQQIVHRGPDSGGSLCESLSESSVGLAMRRLSIIDVNGGTQPITCADGIISIVFNGEIYNYNELRDYCKDKGYTFTTRSDTEVILALYKLEGVDSLSRLDGMFAFSILNRLEGRVILARDYFGEKPLFIRNTEKGLFWSSEIKSLVIDDLGGKPAINTQALAEFFLYQFIPSPLTIYQGIHKVERNSLISIDLKDFTCTTRKICACKVSSSAVKNLAIIKEEVKEIVTNSIQSRAYSEVGLAAFLSGGMDSGVVATCLSESKELQTYTVKVGNDNFDESSDARELADYLDVKNTRLELDGQINLGDLKKAVNVHDQPFADTSLIPTYKLFETCSKTGQKVFLSGDGGDEMFYGYQKYNQLLFSKIYITMVPEFVHVRLAKLISKIDSVGDRSFMSQVIKFLRSVDYKGFGYSKIIMQGYGLDEIDDLLLPNLKYDKQKRLKVIKSIKDAVAYDLDMSLEGGLLPKVDMASMHWSLEVRSPFLNRAIYFYTAGLKEHILVRFLARKRLLKKSFYSSFPKGYLDRKKRGFGFPVSKVLRQNDIRSFLQMHSTSNFIQCQGLFSQAHVEGLMDEFYTRGRGAGRLWTYLCFQIWYLQNIKNE